MQRMKGGEDWRCERNDSSLNFDRSFPLKYCIISLTSDYNIFRMLITGKNIFHILYNLTLWVNASCVEAIPVFQHTQQLPPSGWVYDKRGSEPVHRFHDGNKSKVWSMVYPVARSPTDNKSWTAPHFSPKTYSQNKTYISVYFLILPHTNP